MGFSVAARAGVGGIEDIAATVPAHTAVTVVQVTPRMKIRFYFSALEFPTLPERLAINQRSPISDKYGFKPSSMQPSARG